MKKERTNLIASIQMETLEGIDGCGETCPVMKASRIIDGKWTTLVIRELVSGKKRYYELKRALNGITPKVLAARLRHLEQSAIVERTVIPTIPPSTEYALTPLGRKLEGVIAAMADFGKVLPG